MTLHSILSPVDFSEQSRHALRWAAYFAARFEGRLTVLSVVDPLLAEAAKTRLGIDLHTSENDPALREFVAEALPSDPAVAGTIFKMEVGNPAEVILEAADRESVSMIVMGTQGLGGLRKWLLGSTTEHVLRRTPVPVLAVPRAGDEPGDAGTDDRPVGITRVLAPTDLTESSAAIVKYAAKLAEQLSASLTLAHVVEPLSVPAWWRSLGEGSDDTRAAQARSRLEEFEEQFCGPRGCESVVSVGRASDLIGSIAQDCRADLIVMGLTGDRGALSRRPGSIAYRVLCSTTIPVLVVPPTF